MKRRGHSRLRWSLGLAGSGLAAALLAGAWTGESKWVVLTRAIGSHFLKEVVPAALGSAESARGATHASFDLTGSLGYINEVFDSFAQRLPPPAWRDAAVLEIGPGDNLGLALKLVVTGARQVVALDKFHSRRDEAQQHRIYAALRAELSSAGQHRYDEAVRLEGQVRFNPDRIRYIYGTGIEEAGDLFPAGKFRVILSQSVLQEVHDLDAAFAAMDKLLAPGGHLAHQVDLRDYGLFTSRGFHPLEFLTVPDSLYRLTGKPNCRLIDYYRRKLEDLGYRPAIQVTSLLGRGPGFLPKARLEYGVDYTEADVALVRAIRSRLLPRFQRLPDEDLLVTGIFVLAEKPGH